MRKTLVLMVLLLSACGPSTYQGLRDDPGVTRNVELCREMEEVYRETKHWNMENFRYLRTDSELFDDHAYVAAINETPWTPQLIMWIADMKPGGCGTLVEIHQYHSSGGASRDMAEYLTRK